MWSGLWCSSAGAGRLHAGDGGRGDPAGGDGGAGSGRRLGPELDGARSADEAFTDRGEGWCGNGGLPDDLWKNRI